MKKTFICIAISFVMAFGLTINSADAIIIVSGDSNISDGLSSHAGNQQFFTNVLQGGSNVATLEGYYPTFAENINIFYNGLSGVTSSIITGTVTSANLNGMDLFVSTFPNDPFTTSELTVLNSYLGGGGSIFFLGDHGNTMNQYQVYNLRINAALTALGSNLQIENAMIDNGYHYAGGSQIATDPLTTGVTSLKYASASKVTGGTTLFSGTGGQTFIAYEGSAPVPEPATLLLLGSGLIGMIGWKKKKNLL